MGMWEIREERDDYGRDFGERGGELESAYRAGYEKGCEHGYIKAMHDMNGGSMGFRDGGGYSSIGERSRQTPVYGEFRERRYPYYDDMGERRMRDSRGRYM